MSTETKRPSKKIIETTRFWKDVMTRNMKDILTDVHTALDGGSVPKRILSEITFREDAKPSQATIQYELDHECGKPVVQLEIWITMGDGRVSGSGFRFSNHPELDRLLQTWSNKLVDSIALTLRTTNLSKL